MAPSELTASVPPLHLPRRPSWMLYRGEGARGHFAMVTGPQPGSRGNPRPRLQLKMSFRGTLFINRRNGKAKILW